MESTVLPRTLLNAKSLYRRLEMLTYRTNVGRPERDCTVELEDQKPVVEGGTGVLVVKVCIPYINVPAVKKVKEDTNA